MRMREADKVKFVIPVFESTIPDPEAPGEFLDLNLGDHPNLLSSGGVLDAGMSTWTEDAKELQLYVATQVPANTPVTATLADTAGLRLHATSDYRVYHFGGSDVSSPAMASHQARCGKGASHSCAHTARGTHAPCRDCTVEVAWANVRRCAIAGMRHPPRPLTSSPARFTAPPR